MDNSNSNSVDSFPIYLPGPLIYRGQQLQKIKEYRKLHGTEATINMLMEHYVDQSKYDETTLISLRHKLKDYFNRKR